MPKKGSDPRLLGLSHFLSALQHRLYTKGWDSSEPSEALVWGAKFMVVCMCTQTQKALSDQVKVVFLNIRMQKFYNEQIFRQDQNF